MVTATADDALVRGSTRDRPLTALDILPTRPSGTTTGIPAWTPLASPALISRPSMILPPGIPMTVAGSRSNRSSAANPTMKCVSSRRRSFSCPCEMRAALSSTSSMASLRRRPFSPRSRVSPSAAVARRLSGLSIGVAAIVDITTLAAGGSARAIAESSTQMTSVVRSRFPRRSRVSGDSIGVFLPLR